MPALFICLDCFHGFREEPCILTLATNSHVRFKPQVLCTCNM
ncbi:hypothetical protein SOVF_044470 [Spinacia oleracea]|nr:hypothetical protein SOVF_044470 [Spinacia oleracea]